QNRDDRTYEASYYTYSHLQAYALISSRTQPHPNTTLFPYTTLFRSENQLRFHNFARELHGARLRFDDESRMTAAICARFLRLVIDRKSTRLNSSHRTISYAVFCLKKKINTKDPITTASRT